MAAGANAANYQPSFLAVLQNQINQNNQNTQYGSLNNRPVAVLPQNLQMQQHEGRSSSSFSTAVCCISLICLIAGSTMWGVCNEPTSPGCNETIKLAGQIMTYTSAAIISVAICCICSLACCLGVGMAAQNSQQSA